MSVRIYTDGSAKGNPGPGGYGIILLSNEGHRKELAQGLSKNYQQQNGTFKCNCSIRDLKARPEDALITIYSDSKYVVDAVEKKWVFKWEKTFFKNKKP